MKGVFGTARPLVPRRTLLAAGLALGAAPALAQPASDGASFQSFWQRFRASVLAEDMAALMRMSRMPVASHGELDDEPVRQLGTTGFPTAFRRLLRTADEPGSRRTVLDVIRGMPEPRLDPRNAAPGQVRIDNLVFERGRDGWRLTTLYRGPEG